MFALSDHEYLGFFLQATNSDDAIQFQNDSCQLCRLLIGYCHCECMRHTNVLGSLAQQAIGIGSFEKMLFIVIRQFFGGSSVSTKETKWQ